MGITTLVTGKDNNMETKRIYGYGLYIPRCNFEVEFYSDETIFNFGYNPLLLKNYPASWIVKRAYIVPDSFGVYSRGTLQFVEE